MASTQPIQMNIKKPDLRIDMQLEVDTSVTIYAGTLVGIDSGKSVVATSLLPCAGVACETYEEGEMALIYSNHIVSFNLPGVAESDIGSTAYVSDNDTLTTTPNVATVGRIVGVDTTNEKALVHITFLGGALDSAVDSVFSRTGNVIAVLDDYAASLIDNDSAVSGATVKDALDNLDTILDNTVSGHITLHPCAYSAEDCSWQITGVPGQWAENAFYNKNEASGEYVEWRVYMPKSTSFTLRILHTTDADHGNVQVKLDGVTQGADIDMYTAALVKNVKTDRTISATSAGWQTIRLQVEGKNGSSTSYKMQVSDISLWG